MRGKESTKNNIIRYIGIFDANNEKVKNILKKYWLILISDGDFKDLITPHPSITYKKDKSLRDKMVHSFLHAGVEAWLKSPTIGSFPCGTCMFCSDMPKMNSFMNPLYEKKTTLSKN